SVTRVCLWVQVWCSTTETPRTGTPSPSSRPSGLVRSSELRWPRPSSCCGGVSRRVRAVRRRLAGRPVRQIPDPGASRRLLWRHGRTTGVRNYGTMDPENLYDVYCYVEETGGEVFHDDVPQQLSFHEAHAFCGAAGARLATTAQLYAAWSQGLDHCSPGWLADGSVRYPIRNPRERCGGPQAGVKTLYRFSNQTGFPEASTLHDVFCFKETSRNSSDDVSTEPEDFEQNVVILMQTEQEVQLSQRAETVEREAQSRLESFSAPPETATSNPPAGPSDSSDPAPFQTPEPDLLHSSDPAPFQTPEPDLLHSSDSAPVSTSKLDLHLSSDSAPSKTPESDLLHSSDSAPFQTPESDLLHSSDSAPFQTPESDLLHSSDPAPFQTSKPDLLHSSDPAPFQTPESDLLHSSDPAPFQTSKSDLLHSSDSAPFQTPQSDLLHSSDPAPFQTSKSDLLHSSDSAPFQTLQSDLLHSSDPAPFQTSKPDLLPSSDSAPFQTPESDLLHSSDSAPFQTSKPDLLHSSDSAPFQTSKPDLLLSSDSAPFQTPESDLLHSSEPVSHVHLYTQPPAGVNRSTTRTDTTPLPRPHNQTDPHRSDTPTSQQHDLQSGSNESLTWNQTMLDPNPGDHKGPTKDLQQNQNQSEPDEGGADLWGSATAPSDDLDRILLTSPVVPAETTDSLWTHTDGSGEPAQERSSAAETLAVAVETLAATSHAPPPIPSSATPRPDGPSSPVPPTAPRVRDPPPPEGEEARSVEGLTSDPAQGQTAGYWEWAETVSPHEDGSGAAVLHPQGGACQPPQRRRGFKSLRNSLETVRPTLRKQRVRTEPGYRPPVCLQRTAEPLRLLWVKT
ncbi:hypothetical protein OJAV_G00115820, partial [Oryzias javanicus]